MAVLNNNIRGAIAPHILPFKAGESRVNAFATTFDELLGHVFDIGKGLGLMLVEANAAWTAPTVTGGTFFKWADIDTYKVAVCSGIGDEPCGVTVPSQADLVANDFFLLLVPLHGEPRVTLIDSGSGVTAGDYIQATAAGEAIADATFDHENPGTSCAECIETVAGDLAFNAKLLVGQFGGINA